MSAPVAHRPVLRPTLLALAPPPDLVPVVDYFWQLVLPPGARPGAAFRIVPDGYLEIAVRQPLDAHGATPTHRDPGALAEVVAVCAAATGARRLPLSAEHPLLVTGVRLRLGAAARLLRAAPGELVDRASPLRDVLRGRAAVDVDAALRDGAAGAPRDRGMAALTAAVRRLVARAASAAPGARAVDPRVAHALALLAEAAERDSASAPGGAVIASVARAVGVSVRTLERLLDAYVGVSPRTYLRLRRVCGVAATIERAADRPGDPLAGSGCPLANEPMAASLSHLAHHHGYADHAHMTREFRRMMGVTPSAYRVEAQAAPFVRAFQVSADRAVPLGTLVAA